MVMHFHHTDMQWCPQIGFFQSGLIKEVRYQEEEVGDDLGFFIYQ